MQADHARAANAEKRRGDLPHVPLSDEVPWLNLNSIAIIDLNRALDELEAVDPRKVKLVVWIIAAIFLFRYFYLGSE